MNQQQTCQSELVAESKFSKITVCTHCNLYHLHIGPMSFSMEGAVFESFCTMIVEFFLRHNPTVCKNSVSVQEH